MKRIKWKLLLLVLLICLAFASAAVAVKPVIDGMLVNAGADDES